MEIIESRVQDMITYQVEGRIDTNTSVELQERLLNGFRKTASIILDLEQVDYISSAGLRVLLIGEKTAVGKKGSLNIIHVQPQVMEVFQMSGFDKVLHFGDVNGN